MHTTGSSLSLRLEGCFAVSSSSFIYFSFPPKKRENQIVAVVQLLFSCCCCIGLCFVGLLFCGLGCAFEKDDGPFLLVLLFFGCGPTFCVVWEYDKKIVGF
jgi:hypothetical protein